MRIDRLRAPIPIAQDVPGHADQLIVHFCLLHGRSNQAPIGGLPEHGRYRLQVFIPAAEEGFIAARLEDFAERHRLYIRRQAIVPHAIAHLVQALRRPEQGGLGEVGHALPFLVRTKGFLAPVQPAEIGGRCGAAPCDIGIGRAAISIRAIAGRVLQGLQGRCVTGKRLVAQRIHFLSCGRIAIRKPIGLRHLRQAHGRDHAE